MPHYIVQNGDTGFSIANEFHISFDDLASQNPGVNFLDLQIGQQINVPFLNSGSNSAFNQYTVQLGDIAFDIAQKLGVSLDALVAVNPGVDFNDLQIGQSLNIP